MYELLTGITPFKNYDSKKKLFDDTKNGIRPDLSMIQDEKIREFVSECWSGNPLERPAFIEIVEELKHERYPKYFNANKEEVDSYISLFDKDLINPFLLGDLGVKKEAEKGSVEAAAIL